jgi:serine/threonine protein kinase
MAGEGAPRGLLTTGKACRDLYRVEQPHAGPGWATAGAGTEQYFRGERLSDGLSVSVRVVKIGLVDKAHRAELWSELLLRKKISHCVYVLELLDVFLEYGGQFPGSGDDNNSAAASPTPFGPDGDLERPADQKEGDGPVESAVVYIVEEHVDGGELFDLIVEDSRLSEHDAGSVSAQLLLAARSMHEELACHRDIKPENIMLTSGPELHIKLGAFGLCRSFGSDDQHIDTVRVGKPVNGAPEYLAPEMLSEDLYNPFAGDMWAIGVVAYVSLSGYVPFHADSFGELFRKVAAADYEFFSPEWDAVSQTAKEFVRGLLEKDPDQRLTAAQACEHDFVREFVPMTAVKSARKQ